MYLVLIVKQSEPICSDLITICDQSWKRKTVHTNGHKKSSAHCIVTQYAD